MKRAWSRGEARPLEGVPFGVKDLFDTAGVRTTYGSPMYDVWVPDRAMPGLWRGRRRREAILIGKTATDEFAYGIAGVNPHYGPARNPWSTRIGSQEGARAAAPPSLSPQSRFRSRSAATLAARFGLRRRSAGSSA